VVSAVEGPSFLVLEHPLIHSKNKRINIPANEFKYALELIAAIINISIERPSHNPQSSAEEM
jgi:hypothetical protein